MRMLDIAVSWVLSHPLEFVGGMAATAIAIAIRLVPRLNEHVEQGHPRC